MNLYILYEYKLLKLIENFQSFKILLPVKTKTARPLSIECQDRKTFPVTFVGSSFNPQ